MVHTFIQCPYLRGMQGQEPSHTTDVVLAVIFHFKPRRDLSVEERSDTLEFLRFMRFCITACLLATCSDLAEDRRTTTLGLRPTQCRSSDGDNASFDKVLNASSSRTGRSEGRPQRLRMEGRVLILARDICTQWIRMSALRRAKVTTQRRTSDDLLELIFSFYGHARSIFCVGRQAPVNP